MSSITPITTTQGEFLAVNLPEGQTTFKINKIDVGDPDDYLYLTDVYDIGWTKLPPGPWEIMNLASLLTEEQCETITPYGYDGTNDENINGYIYECFDNSNFTCDTAKDCFNSLLRSHGIHLVNPFPNPKDRHPMCRDCADEDGTCPNYAGRFCDPNLRLKQWQEAQSKVYDPLILRKVS